MENVNKYISLRESISGRVDSSHLLIKLLINLNTRFDGDLFRYAADVEAGAAKRICGILGITSSFSKGKLFTEGVFYQGCPEIIIYSSSTKYSVSDLWKNWKSVSAVEVLCHPITSSNIIELGVMDSAFIRNNGLVIVNIDIPLLAAQWKLWSASQRTSGEYEKFLTEVVFPNMIYSHLNVVMFNVILEKLGIIKASVIETNLPFAQIPVDTHISKIADLVLDRLSKTSVTANQMLSTIPALIGSNFLDEVAGPSTLPSNQVRWALLSFKMLLTAYVLEIAKYNNYAKITNELNSIKRELVIIEDDKIFSNGLSTAVQTLLLTRLNDLVVSRLP